MQKSIPITKQEFDLYLNIQKSGFINMFDVRIVQELTGLTKDKIIMIMENYSELSNLYQKG